MNDVALVACSKLKLGHRAKAKDMYVSPLFKMARAYAERHARRWFIMSAHLALVDPEKSILPYNLSLDHFPADHRREWAKYIVGRLRANRVQGQRVIVLAGHLYREHLMDYLTREFDEVVVPLEGMKIGEQLSWLSKRTSLKVVK
jgi:hypothetical protein